MNAVNLSLQANNMNILRSIGKISALKETKTMEKKNE